MTTNFKESLLSKVKQFVIDGIFKIIPFGVFPTINFAGIVFKKILSFCLYFNARKTEEFYVKAFNQCKKLFNIKPDFIISDFERDLVNAVSICFEDVVYKLCNFHMNQAVWRRIQGMGYVKAYKADKKFN